MSTDRPQATDDGAASPQEVPTSRAPIRPLTRVHAAAIMLGVGIFWAPVVVALVKGLKGPVETFVIGVTKLTVTFCIVAGLAALLDRWMRRRSRWPGVVAFVVLAVLVLMIFLSAFSQSRTMRDIAEFERAADVQLDRLLTLSATSPTAAEWRSAVDRGREALRPMADHLRPSQAAFQLISFDMTCRMMEAQRPYAKALAAYQAAGAGTVAGVSTSEQARERLRLIEDARNEFTEYLRFLGALRGTFERRLAEEGLNAADFKHGIDKRVAFTEPGSRVFQEHEMELAMLDGQVDYWELLVDAWGAWEARGQQVLFSGEKAQERLARFNQILEKIKTAAAKQQELKSRSK